MDHPALSQDIVLHPGITDDESVGRGSLYHYGESLSNDSDSCVWQAILETNLTYNYRLIDNEG